MSTQFNFGRLHAIYSAAWTKNEPTIAFEVIQGRGRFVFMIFFSPEDKGSYGEHLFIYLAVCLNSLLFLPAVPVTFPAVGQGNGFSAAG